MSKSDGMPRKTRRERARYFERQRGEAKPVIRFDPPLASLAADVDVDRADDPDQVPTEWDRRDGPTSRRPA